MTEIIFNFEKRNQDGDMKMSENRIEKSELMKILRNHRCWLDTFGEQGERADLSSRNLSRYNLQQVAIQINPQP